MEWDKTTAAFGFVEVAFQIFFFPCWKKKVAFLIPLFKIKTRHKDTKQNSMYKAKVNFYKNINYKWRGLYKVHNYLVMENSIKLSSCCQVSAKVQ